MRKKEEEEGTEDRLKETNDILFLSFMSILMRKGQKTD